MPRHHKAGIEIGMLERMSRAELRECWKKELSETPPRCLGRDVLALGVAYAMQEHRHGGLSKAVAKELDRLLALELKDTTPSRTGRARKPGAVLPRIGTVLVREWQGTTHHVTIARDGFLWNGQTHRSLSSVAQAITGAKWNGPRFFGMRDNAVRDGRG
jgi:Protein of unknown function (DUF2924)